jgi:hypothetical protein
LHYDDYYWGSRSIQHFLSFTFSIIIITTAFSIIHTFKIRSLVSREIEKIEHIMRW